MITVHSAACPKLPDGRTRHIFRKVAGEFVCDNCGQVSDPAQRWEEPETKFAAAQRAASPSRRDQDCQVLGDHASLPAEESARGAAARQQFRTRVSIQSGGKS